MSLETNRKYVEEVLLPAKAASREEAKRLPYYEKLAIVKRMRDRVAWVKVRLTPEKNPEDKKIEKS